MFGKRAAAAEVEAPAPVNRVPLPRITIGAVPSYNYIEKCEAIGANQLARWERLKMIVALESPGLYDIDEVNEFLCREAPLGMGVKWNPLCGVTCPGNGIMWSYDIGGGGNSYVYLVPKPKYSKSVPLRALNLISTIEKEIPGVFGFYVSDYAVARPDPFLLVHDNGTQRSMIVMHWDEPRWDARVGHD